MLTKSKNSYKIKIISDLHLDFDSSCGDSDYLDNLQTNGADILIVAGDIATDREDGTIIKSALRQLCDKFEDIVYVYGNHCIWNSSFDKRNQLFSDLDAKISNLHWLDKSCFEKNGQRFVGATGWFGNSYNVSPNWIDFRKIEDNYKNIFEEHSKAKHFLEQTVHSDDIVITHHIPVYDCVTPRWQDNPMNSYFVSNFDKVVINNRPKVWIFGHTHDNINMLVQNTHMICNPRGYPGENFAHNPNLTIKI